MRVFWFGIWALLGYIWIIVIGVLNPHMFNLVIVEPVNAYRGFIQQNMDTASTALDMFQFRPAKNAPQGVIAFDEDKSFEGYTFLISNANDMAAELIDMNGNIVHKWYVPIDQIHEHLPRINPEQDRPLTQMTRAFFDPSDGSVILMYQIRKNPYTQLGILKIDHQSRIIWGYDDNTHHHAELNDDGSLYVLNQRDRFEDVKTQIGIKAPIWDEYIVHLDKNGQKIKELSIITLLEKANLISVLDERMGNGVSSDIIHANMIEIVPQAAIGKTPFYKEGHIMISLRKTDLLFMVDPDKEEITWASFGPWKAQHSPQIQPDGSVMVFDNLGALSSNGRSSRILQFDPVTMETLWEYRGTTDNPFYSYHSASLQVLPNDNILITEAVTGRVFEVTRDKEIVWDYWNTKREIQNNIEFIPAIHSAVRYSKEDIKFKFQNK